jgi:phage terminase small subunit
LLVRYCENAVLARRAAAALTSEGPVVAGRTNPWLVVAEKCDRALVALSMRLRISPQARMRRETTVPKGPPASIYDLMREQDDAEE